MLPPSRWDFPPPDVADEHGLVCVGGDLEPSTLLHAYSHGLFPMPVGRRRLGWWSPDPRAVIPLDGLRVTRSLRTSCRRFEVRVDERFEEVMRACGDPRRPHGWITEPFVAAYCRLHELGFAHSVETYDGRGRLVGGLYGVSVGGLFAGESMFHRARDASKVALVALVHLLRAGHFRLLDVQWETAHLASLGAVAVPRPRYLELLAAARTAPAEFPTALDPGWRPSGPATPPVEG
jgi:leucyl/phenylalanyl-tRNA---protein transferase